MFSVESAPTLYNMDPRPAEWVQLRDIRRTVTTWEREAEEYPLLEAAARKRLMKSWRAAEDLVFRAVICKVWRSAMALQLLIVPSGVNKSINQSIPRLESHT
jgi:hypothetical protein